LVLKMQLHFTKFVIFTNQFMDSRRLPALRTIVSTTFLQRMHLFPI
jgi:hypothetical protein